MFKELLSFAKSLQKEKRVSSFFLLIFEFAVIFALNYFACRFNVFFTVKNSRLFSALLFFVVSVVAFCLFKVLNLCFFSSGIVKKKKLGFKRFAGCMALEFLLIVLKVLILLFCFLPFLLMFFFLLLSGRGEVPLFASAVIFAFCVSLLYVGARFYFRFSSCLFLSEYIYVFTSENTVFSAITKSIQKTDGNSKRLLKLKNSFFPLEVLCASVIFIPFVFGYRKRALAIFAYGLI